MTRESEGSLAIATCLSEDEILAFAGGQLSTLHRRDAHLHFDECALCQRMLTEAVRALATAATHGFDDHDEVAWNATFRAGALVGHRYVIRRFIARGGMGEVYEAFDQELQERVALKTVTATACDDPNAVRRLKAEVQLARRVGHPNVCRIYDFGTHVAPSTGAQISFLTMEFVDGLTLGQRIRQGALPVAEARALGRQLLRGLSAAHGAGVLHRDFKSDNVMLREDDEGRICPLILDFGLARTVDEHSRSQGSGGHGLVGTFAYIAPEQLEGKPHSTTSDIYSFGLVWFEMLTGELPFKLSSSPAATTLERLRRPAPAPSSINPLVPADLDALVLRCLERKPENRFQSADEALLRLDQADGRRSMPLRSRALAPLVVIASILGAVTYATVTAVRARAVTPVVAQRSAPSPSPAPPSEANALLPVSVPPPPPSPNPAPLALPKPLPAASVLPTAAGPPPRPEGAGDLKVVSGPSHAPTVPSAERDGPAPAASSSSPHPDEGWENPFARASARTRPP